MGKLQGRTAKGSTFTLQDLKDELFEDWNTAIRNNMETFAGKFALYQRQLQEELTRTMEEGTSRIIDELNRGAHDKIKNEVTPTYRVSEEGRLLSICVVFSGAASDLEGNGTCF